MKGARGLGNVYQPSYRMRKTGELKKCETWWIVYHVNGRRIAENAHTENRADAIKLLKARTGDAASGRPVGPQLDRTNLDDLLAMVEADYQANSRRSLDRVQQAAIHLRNFFRGNRKARDITSDRITAFAAHRLEDGAKASTVNYEMAVLRRGFRLGEDAGKVGIRPKFSMLQVSNTRTGFFEPEQYRAVVAHLPNYLKPVAQAAYITGWRTRSELLTRQWRHVDLTAGWLRLDSGEGKTGEGRMFPLSPELREVLENQRERVREIEKTMGQIIPWVFVHPDGSPIRDFRGAWAKACRDAGVPGRLVHDFRRTAVRNLERAGVPRSAAMKLTGHKTEAVYQRYAITDSTMLQEAVIKLSALHAAEAAPVENRKSSAKVSASAVEQ
jgi:integrase